MNGLRNKVRIETDGKLMSGRDVAIAALLGAEEFGFATGSACYNGMCHDACLQSGYVSGRRCYPESGAEKAFPRQTGIRGKLHAFIAQNLREYMAKLGFRTVDEMVGRSDLLKKKEVCENEKGCAWISAIF